MVDADEVNVPVTADDREFERTMRKVEQRLDKFEKDSEKRDQRGGRSRGAFLGGAVGGFAGAAVAQSPIGQAIGGVFSSLVSAIALPIMISFLPLIQQALEFLTKPGTQNALQKVGSGLAGGAGAFIGTEDEISGLDILGATAIGGALGFRVGGPWGAAIGGGTGLAVTGGRRVSRDLDRGELFGQELPDFPGLDFIGPGLRETQQTIPRQTRTSTNIPSPFEGEFIPFQSEQEFNDPNRTGATFRDPDVQPMVGTNRRNATNPTGGTFG